MKVGVSARRVSECLGVAPNFANARMKGEGEGKRDQSLLRAAGMRRRALPVVLRSLHFVSTNWSHALCE
jgi:hypothetical protein